MVTYRNAYDTQICVWAELPTQICVSHAFHDMCLTLPMQRVLFLNSTIIKIERSFINGDVIAQPNKVTNVPDWIMSTIDWYDPENEQQEVRHWNRLVLYGKFERRWHQHETSGWLQNCINGSIIMFRKQCPIDFKIYRLHPKLWAILSRQIPRLNGPDWILKFNTYPESSSKINNLCKILKRTWYQHTTAEKRTWIRLRRIACSIW